MFFGTVTLFKNLIFNFFSEIFFMSPKAAPSILSYFAINEFQKAQRGPITVHMQAILLLFVESGTRKLRKVVESRTKFLFDGKRVLDSFISMEIVLFDTKNHKVRKEILMTGTKIEACH